MEKAALRYAQALAELAQSEGSSVSLLLEMRLVHQLCSKDVSLSHFLSNPLVEAKKKHRLLQTVLTTDLQPLTQKLLDLLAQRNRFKLLPAIIEALISQLEQRLNVVHARVYTACRLSQELLEEFRGVVRTVSGCQEVEMAVEIYPSLLGGYVLQTDTWRLDNSVLGRLNMVRKSCK